MQRVRLPPACGRSPRGASGSRRWKTTADHADGARVIVFIGIMGRETKAALRDGIVRRSAVADWVATTSNVD
ncbi:hypothetical protein A9Z05_01450 [Burkholderia sp. A2]|nr:hypothetical protein A9Z05_01450 [Burkholderia sp. A2]